MIFLHFQLAFAAVLNLTILYELNSNEYAQALQAVANLTIQQYNQLLRPKDVSVNLTNVLSYFDYSQIPELRNLAFYAGTPNVVDRTKELKEIDGHVIMLISSLSKASNGGFKLSSICKSRYFLSIFPTKNITLPEACSKAIREWLSELLEYDLPEINNDESTWDISDLEVPILIKHCESIRRLSRNKIENQHFKRKIKSTIQV